MSLVRTIVKSALPPAITVRLRAAFKRHETERALLPALCDPSRAGIDIGAALGAYTWPLSRLCSVCIAFEPNPIQARYLCQAFGKSVRIENLALSDRNGEVELVIPIEGSEEMAGLATIDPGKWLDGKQLRREKVAMRTLDSFSLEPTGFIKLDVEGHELAVLKGAAELISRDKPTLLVELEERFTEGSIARVCAFLEPFGYRGFFLDQHTIRDISAFDAGIHQAMENWGTIGAYINNFIFIHEDRLAVTSKSLSGIGYPVAP